MVDNVSLQDPLNFECWAGEYLRAFSLVDLSSSSSSPTPPLNFNGSVYLNSDNSLVADVQPHEGIISIFRTESQYNPLRVVSGPPVMRVAFQAFDASSGEYVYSVEMSGLPSSTFVHPMSGANTRPILLPGERVIASCTWDYAGAALFIVWMDGTISMAVAAPAVRISFLQVISFADDQACVCVCVCVHRRAAGSSPPGVLRPRLARCLPPSGPSCIPQRLPTTP